MPSFMNPPAPVDESKVTETVGVDVCVVGLGLAGVCALREAAESGAKTFGFDKGSTGLPLRRVRHVRQRDPQAAGHRAA
ncbi:MAG: hypothetical protein ACLTMP_11675 [Eggerthella lenta]